MLPKSLVSPTEMLQIVTSARAPFMCSVAFHKQDSAICLIFLAEKLGSQNPGGATNESWPCLFLFKDEIALEVRSKASWMISDYTRAISTLKICSFKQCHWGFQEVKLSGLTIKRIHSSQMTDSPPSFVSFVRFVRDRDPMKVQLSSFDSSMIAHLQF